eukprot:COSAG02_NODE_2330_length_9119_cov_11.886918_3_plen_165_part_00
MDSATFREDLNGLSSVANIRRKREERQRDRAETARRQQRAVQGKKRSQTVTVMSGEGQAISGMVDAYFEEDEEGAQEIVQMIRQAEAIRDSLDELEREHGNFSDPYLREALVSIHIARLFCLRSTYLRRSEWFEAHAMSSAHRRVITTFARSSITASSLKRTYM